MEGSEYGEFVDEERQRCPPRPYGVSPRLAESQILTYDSTWTLLGNGACEAISLGVIPYGTGPHQRVTLDVEWTRFRCSVRFGNFSAYTAAQYDKATTVVGCFEAFWVDYARVGDGSPIREKCYGSVSGGADLALYQTSDPYVIPLLSWRFPITTSWYWNVYSPDHPWSVRQRDLIDGCRNFDIPVPPHCITHFRAGTGSTVIRRGYLAICAHWENMDRLAVPMTSTIEVIVKMHYRQVSAPGGGASYDLSEE